MATQSKVIREKTSLRQVLNRFGDSLFVQTVERMKKDIGFCNMEA